jgi:hypothetical protein
MPHFENRILLLINEYNDYRIWNLQKNLLNPSNYLVIFLNFDNL